MSNAEDTRRKRVGAALIGGLLLSLTLVAGCDGDDGDADPTATAPSSSPVEEQSAPAPTAESALPLDRYHYVASLTLRETKPDGAEEVVISTEGDYQSPDRHALTHTIRSGSDVYARSAVMMGDRAWYRISQGAWLPVTREDARLTSLASTAFSPLRQGFLGGPSFADVQKNVRRLTPTVESVNGVSANHYNVDAAGREFVLGFLLDDANQPDVQDLAWDLWLADDGDWPVRLVASGTTAAGYAGLDELQLEAPVTWELRIDISRPNDPALAIAAPS
ncbi:MAG: hypothetical protein WEE64_14920 [Dehalococcoidia bacterium]